MKTQSFEKIYKRSDLSEQPSGVISASMAIRYFNKTNPGWKVKNLQGFKMNHEAMTVTLKVVAVQVDIKGSTNFCENCVKLQKKIDKLMQERAICLSQEKTADEDEPKFVDHTHDVECAASACDDCVDPDCPNNGGKG